MKGCMIRDVIGLAGAVIEIFTGKDQALGIGRKALSDSVKAFDGVDMHIGGGFKSDCLAIKTLHENGHTSKDRFRRGGR